jgi:sugar phosphate isomerase/epimerase
MAGLEHGISCLFASLAAASHFGSREAGARQAAFNRVLAALDRATWLGARVLVLETAAVVGADCTYAEALNGTHAALQRLRLAAQRRGVCLALAAPQARFLLSPVEFRNLLDEQCEPAVGAALDVPACQALGEPADWIGTLGWEVSCILLREMTLQANATGTSLIAELITTANQDAFEGPVCSSEPAVVRFLAGA